MDVREAIKRVKKMRKERNTVLSLLPKGARKRSDYNNDVLAFTTAIEVLEKQLPKKPTYEGDGYASDGTFIWDEWLCPNCGSRYEVDYDDYGYCPNCGQRIDWEEEENERT